MIIIRTPKLFLMLLLLPTLLMAEESRWFPSEHLYPTYLADPYALGFHIQVRSYQDATIPQTGSSRWDLKTGAPLLLYEERDASNAQHGWQMIFLGGLRGQFDMNNSQNNIAWEGMFGLRAVFRYHDNFTWHFGVKHFSSHVGDEYIESTGHTRVGYTRDEFRAGFAWLVRDHLTFYSDVGYAYSLSDEDLQDDGQVQFGLQFEKPGLLLDGKAGWYWALDISSYEEDDSDNNITLQTGVDMRTHDRRWRFGLEYYDGRSQYGEFFQDRDKYTGIGVWIDI